MPCTRRRSFASTIVSAHLVAILSGCDGALVGPDPVRDLGEAEMCRLGEEGTLECGLLPPPPRIRERSSFADESAFGNHVGGLIGLSKSELKLSEQQKSYQTLRAYLDSNEDTEASALAASGDGPTGNEATALQNDGVTRADFPVGDALLSVLNQRGEVQIGGTIFKVTRDNVYQVAAADIALLNQKVPTLSSPAPTDGDPRIVVHPVETTAVAYDAPAANRIPAPGAASFDHVPGVGPHCYVYAGSNRMHGESYISNYLFYSEAGVATEWQRRKSFLWWSYWGNTWQNGSLGVNYDGQLLSGLFTVPLVYVGPGTGSRTGVSTDRVHKVLTWKAGFGTQIRGKIHARHTFSNSVGSGFCDTAVSK